LLLKQYITLQLNQSYRYSGNIMMKMQDIARVVRFHRKKAGLSQEGLARLAGVGKTAVFDLEKGKETTQLDTYRKILAALNITMKLESPLMAQYEREASDSEGMASP
jgi:HTH-type transcriptional regulator/antitoxin HipB